MFGEEGRMFLLAGASAFYAFIAIAAFGALFVVTSFVVGELFELGDFFGHHDVDIHGGGPSLISSRVISVFVTAFGCFGAIGIHMGWSVGISTAFGAGGGVAFGAVIYLFMSFLYSQQASSDVRVADLVGQTAKVSVAIPKGGVGQIRCTLGESVVDKIARSTDGGEIPANMLVKVEQLVGETVLVRRAE